MSVASQQLGHSRLNTPLRRFLHNRMAVAGLGVLAVLLGAAFVSLPYSSAWYNVQDLKHAVRCGPTFKPVTSLERMGEGVDATGTPVSTSRLTRMAHGVSSWLGHDELGRSLLYRLLPGMLISLGVGLGAAAIAVLIGTAWGATAARVGGKTDALLMRIVDVLYSLPYILTVVLLKVTLTAPLSALFGDRRQWADLVILFLAIGGVSWLTMARVIRGQVLSLRSRPFVEAARSMGAGHLHILLRHILPNLIGPITVYAALVIPQAILQESFLSFLGIGVQQPMPSLGRLAADGVEAVNMFVSFWWLLLFPCGVLVVTLLAMNFVADAVRDAVDPKSPSTAPF